jgi:hypothetical protein
MALTRDIGLGLVTLGLLWNCSGGGDQVVGGTAAGGGSAGVDSGSGGFFPGAGGIGIDLDAGFDAGPRLEDFPAAAIIEGDAPSNAPDLFAGGTETGAGPCIVAPEPGTLFPKNWLRPKFEFASAADHDLFEIVVSTARFEHPLRIYTTEPGATFDRALWDGLRNAIVDEVISVRIRSAKRDGAGGLAAGPTLASESSFTIAPVEAPGKIVYWALPADEIGVLKGFGIGEEGVVTALTPGQVQARDGQAQCVGCHTATPDGHAVGFSVGPLDFTNSIATIEAPQVGAVPAMVDSSALTELSGLRGLIAFSAAHWTTGNHVALLSDNGDQLYALNLDTPASTGAQPNPRVVQRQTDPNKVTAPAWSRDGATIVYTSVAGSIVDGRPDTGPMDLFRVPYNGGNGGMAEPIAGAASAEYIEYYPAFSPDDDLVAFTRAPSDVGSYNQPQAEIFVIPPGGGTATRLNANDPPACTGKSSPGVTNSWPKWSPYAETRGERTFYFLTFSSTRRGTPQLFVTAIVREGTSLTTYPALHLWNQPADEGNHTPSWEKFKIPPVPVPH